MNPRIADFITGILVGIFLASIGFSVVYRSLDHGSASDALVLKLGHGLDPTHPVHLGMTKMRERLEELSGGRMTIDIYPSGMLGSETQCLEQVQNGQLDMTKSSLGPMESFWPEVRLFGLPYIFRDGEHLWKALEGDVGKIYLEMSGPLYGLCYYDAGARSFYTTRRPALSPAEMKGMKIRVQQSRTSMDMVRYLGASATPISWGELYTALAQGTVDGAENNLPSFESGRHSEICKYYVFNEHAFVPDLLIINRDRWESLAQEQQNWLRQAAEESSFYQRQIWKEEEQRCRTEAEHRGVTFLEVDKEPFRAATAPMRSNIDDPFIADMLKKIEEIR